jgi:hypothetical protein
MNRRILFPVALLVLLFPGFSIARHFGWRRCCQRDCIFTSSSTANIAPASTNKSPILSANGPMAASITGIPTPRVFVVSPCYRNQQVRFFSRTSKHVHGTYDVDVVIGMYPNVDPPRLLIEHAHFDLDLGPGGQSEFSVHNLPNQAMALGYHVVSDSGKEWNQQLTRIAAR